jgi:hypothetical protein
MNWAGPGTGEPGPQNFSSSYRFSKRGVLCLYLCAFLPSPGRVIRTAAPKLCGRGAALRLLHAGRGPPLATEFATSAQVQRRFRVFATGTQTAYENRNRQIAVRPTGLPGTDHRQYIYVMRCGDCGQEYRANGSDIYERKCPKCQGRAPGLSY